MWKPDRMKIFFSKKYIFEIHVRQYLNKKGEFLKSNGIEVQLVASALIQIASPKGTGNGTTLLNWQVIDN